jgi:hypothetical protein
MLASYAIFPLLQLLLPITFSPMLINRLDKSFMFKENSFADYGIQVENTQDNHMFLLYVLKSQNMKL